MPAQQRGVHPPIRWAGKGREIPRRKGDGHLNATIQLECLPQHFAVCKLQDLSGVDLTRPYTFVAHTPEELSLVCPEEAVPPSARPVERGWRCLRVSGSLDFSLVGVLSGITGALAAGGVSVFAVSTYNTDYLLVRLPQYQTALRLLLQGGYQIAGQPREAGAEPSGTLPLAPAHLPALADLYVQVFGAPPWSEPWTADTALERLRLLSAREGAFGLVHLRDGAPLGFILGAEEPFAHGAVFEIKELCTHPAARHRGIGGGLLGSLEDLLRRRKVAETALITSRLDATQGFYRRRGYTSGDHMAWLSKAL